MVLGNQEREMFEEKKYFKAFIPFLLFFKLFIPFEIKHFFPSKFLLLAFLSFKYFVLFLMLAF